MCGTIFKWILNKNDDESTFIIEICFHSAHKNEVYT